MRSVLVIEGISTGRDYVREIAERGMLPVVFIHTIRGRRGTTPIFALRERNFAPALPPHIFFADTDDPEAILRLVEPFAP